jgi:hypothetical protein
MIDPRNLQFVNVVGFTDVQRHWRYELFIFVITFRCLINPL